MQDSSKANKKVVLALGFFDGIHKGHRVVLQHAYEMATEHDAELLVLSLGDSFLQKISKETKLLIYTQQEKSYLFEVMGVKFAALEDDSLANISAEQFLEMIMLENIVGVVAGHDYRFGFEAKGDIKLLCEYASRKGIRAKIVELYKENGKKVSTSSIKEMLLEGRLDEANELLYRPYTMLGKVEKGKGLGSKILFPTANITPFENKLVLPSGVYITETIDIINRRIYRSLTHIGTQPTFDCQKSSVETMLLGFEGDLYENYIEINFLKKLRDVKKFENAEALKSQIQTDITAALNFGFDFTKMDD